MQRRRGYLIGGWNTLSLFLIGSQSGGCFTEYFRILHYAVGDNKIHLLVAMKGVISLSPEENNTIIQSSTFSREVSDLLESSVWPERP